MKMVKQVNLLNKFEDYLISLDFSSNPTLDYAMKYSLLAGGKRFRPRLMFACAKALNVKEDDLFELALAIEMIHTYSLIHDDLPAMDNDDYRRGLLTNHRVNGEDIAILAGDNLLTKAFHYAAIAVSKYNLDCSIIQLLSDCSALMVEGQVIDIKQEITNVNELLSMYYKKTGALVSFSLIAPFYFTNSHVDLSRFAYLLGLSFQLRDDLLEYESDEKVTGKSFSDIDNNKATIVKFIGYEKTKNLLEEYIIEAETILVDNNLYTDEFKEILEMSKNRLK